MAGKKITLFIAEKQINAGGFAGKKYVFTYLCYLTFLIRRQQSCNIKYRKPKREENSRSLIFSSSTIFPPLLLFSSTMFYLLLPKSIKPSSSTIVMNVITCYIGLATPFTIALPTQNAPKLNAL